MTELLHLSVATGWHKSLNRTAISRVLRSDQLIDRMIVYGDGRLEVKCIGWDNYWAPAQPGLNVENALRLQALKSHRKAYFASGYDLNLAPPYCQAYFCLLRALLTGAKHTPTLRSLLGLESFGITWWTDDKDRAAGVVTVRHPAYLLAKLREPKAYDDAKFLPIVYPLGDTDSGSANLFYYYRQIKIQDDPSASLLIYPAVDLANRTESFACIEAASSALSFKPDPRSRQRATAITDWAIAPFLKHPSTHDNRQPELSFVDIGGGSGSLLSEVSKQLIKSHRVLLKNRKFAWSIVDLGLQDATRRTHSPELRQHMSYIDYQPADYMTWIAEESTRIDCHKSDVVLICRLLNNLSRTNIEHSSSPDVVAEMTRVRNRPSPTIYHPADCLREPIPDCKSLIASNARVRLLDGTTFRQASLSDYYRGLYHISDQSGIALDDRRSLFFPIRRFNLEALILPDGGSILERLSRLAGLIVIEDVDLTAAILRSHLETLGLHHLAASDATDRVRMQSASLLCVTRRELESTLPGRRIW